MAENVASLAEAWIEIFKIDTVPPELSSPPSRRRGLKSDKLPLAYVANYVASLAEAWIEILVMYFCIAKFGRLPRGGVD